MQPQAGDISSSARRGAAYGGPLVVLLLAMMARLASLVFMPDALEADVDGYRSLARNVVTHGVYGTEDSPTAYRPPLYPLLLSPFTALGSPADTVAIGALHVLFGLGTVWLTYRVGLRLALGRAALVAAALVAVDPLLLVHTALVMTEPLFALLLVALIGLIGWAVDRATTLAWFLAGIWAGLTVLCRSETWLFLGLVALLRFGSAMRRDQRRFGQRLWRGAQAALPLVLGAVLICVPWVVRNWRSFGVPIVTTTHGGYTFLLANNPVFYREVVHGPTGAVWSKESLERWNRSLAQRTAGMTEVERDRFCYRQAWQTIRRQPGDFLRSCFLRIGRLWRPVPHRLEAAKDRPDWLRYAIGAFYALEMILAALGLGQRKSWRGAWSVLVLLVVSTTVVYTFYWSNMRMRTGLAPVVGLLAAAGLCRVFPPWFRNAAGGPGISGAQ